MGEMRAVQGRTAVGHDEPRSLLTRTYSGSPTGSQRLSTRWTWTSAALSTSPSSYSRLPPTRSASNEGPPSAGVTWTSSPAITPDDRLEGISRPFPAVIEFDFQHVRVDVRRQGGETPPRGPRHQCNRPWNHGHHARQ